MCEVDPFDPETWMCGCVGHQIKAMMAMAETCLDFPVLPFATIARWSGLTLEQTKASVRQLAAKGVAEFWQCSWTDEGEMRGAGYALTAQGRSAVAAIELRKARAALSTPKIAKEALMGAPSKALASLALGLIVVGPVVAAALYFGGF